MNIRPVTCLLLLISSCQAPESSIEDAPKGYYYALKEIAVIRASDKQNVIGQARQFLLDHGIRSYFRGSAETKVWVHNRDVATARSVLGKRRGMAGLSLHDKPLPVPLPEYGYPPDVMAIASVDGERKVELTMKLVRIMRENGVSVFAEAISGPASVMAHDIDADKAARILTSHLDTLGTNVHPVNPPEYVEKER